MNFKSPKNTQEFVWTKHAVAKMRFYGLTQNRIKKIFRSPARVEEGIAPGTIAVMQKAGKGKRSGEVWAMYQGTRGGQKKVVTAWRYPCASPVRGGVPVPPEISAELGLVLKS